MSKYYLLQDADYLTEVQVDFGGSSEGLQGGAEAVGGFFDVMKELGEAFSSISSCAANCKSDSVVIAKPVILNHTPDGMWIYSISEMLYRLNTQVFILTCMFGLYLALKIAKPFVVARITKKNQSKKKEVASEKPLD